MWDPREFQECIFALVTGHFYVPGFHWLMSCRIRIMKGKLQRLDNLPSAPHILLLLLLLPTFLPSGFHTRLQLYSWPAVYELMSAASLSHTLSVTQILSPPPSKVPICLPSFGCYGCSCPCCPQLRGKCEGADVVECMMPPVL